MIELDKVQDLLNKNKSAIGQGTVGNVFYKFSFEEINRPIFVTFGSMGMVVSQHNAIDIGFSPWGFNFAKKLGLNVLSFSSFKESNWYRCPIFHDWLEENKGMLDIFPEKLGYGGSMGGYAAAAFFKVLNLDRVLLLNPISTLNKRVVPWETRPFDQAAELWDWEGKFSDAADEAVTGWVVYDSIFNLDRRHATRFENCKKIVFPGVGHQIPKHLNNLGLLKGLLNSFVENEFDDYKFYSELKKRRNYLHYFQWLESSQNNHLTNKRRDVIAKYKADLLNKAEHETSAILADKLSKIALMVEEYDLDAYDNLNLLAKKVEVGTIEAVEKNDVELLKYSALKFERKNIKIALALMTIALELRPSGPFLARKVQEYERHVKAKS